MQSGCNGEWALDRSTSLTWAIERGAQALILERACDDAYSKATSPSLERLELAGLSVRDTMLRCTIRG